MARVGVKARLSWPLPKAWSSYHFYFSFLSIHHGHDQGGNDPYKAHPGCDHRVWCLRHENEFVFQTITAPKGFKSLVTPFITSVMRGMIASKFVFLLLPWLIMGVMKMRHFWEWSRLVITGMIAKFWKIREHHRQGHRHDHLWSLKFWRNARDHGRDD